MPKQHAPLPQNENENENENEFEFETCSNEIPSRAPLISITDPSQYQSRGEPHLKKESNSAQITPIAAGGVGISTPTHIEDDHNVQVLIRMRPLSSTELISQGNQRCLIQETPHTLVWKGHPETRFAFDHIASETISQEKLFRLAGLPMLNNCLSGYNSCMFAYGQTGSGKTYTMMGEIDKMDGKLSHGCGITPRIFHYLFTRITKEEDSRKHERLTYSCKCSFLEIYNDQITDLLEPSSTNLQLREDSKKGIYVENLTGHSVRTVNDVLQLLQQGAANRKIAATHMNSESSRSHSVFTCVVESRWEKDSMTHLRFGRLNLVDLAGSERQKSSGAEGDRLKEAANINKSLSTLGLVIMSLVDLAQGKHRHVPYRDSRLTFLLQDSLGGNSKTTIIANVSPSICSANETLSTLKFAQRVKLIQNNAKINEDASGGVIALQQQVQQLKDQLSFLMKHQHTPMELTDFVPRLEQATLGHFSETYEPSEEISTHDEHTTPKEVIRNKNYLEGTLHGEQRRDKLAETEVRRLKAEIEQLNRLDHQKEEKIQHSKMMLKFHEEKIKHLELLSDGLVSTDKFYLDKNNALREENLLLQEKNSRNLEVNKLTSYNLSADEVIIEENDLQRENIHRQLVDAQCLIEAMKLEQSNLIKELESAQSENQHLRRRLDTVEVEQRKLGDSKETQSCSGNQDLIVSTESSKGFDTDTASLDLQTKLEKLSKDLMEAQILNRRFMEDHETRLSQDHQTELIRSEVEMETTKTIIQLQEEIDRLKSEFQVCLCSVAEQNLSLRNSVAAKEDELRESCTEWERATLELTMFLTNGSRSLRDTSCEIKSITSSFQNVSDWITEQVERAAKKCVEKEETILVLHKSLEDAQNTMMQMEQKLFCLKDATIALSEFPEPEKSSSIEEIQLSRLPNDSFGVEEFPENKSMSVNGHITHNQTNTHILEKDRISDCAGVVGNPSLDYTNAFVGKNLQNDEVQFSSRETANILCLLEECFLVMQTRMEKLSQTECTDAIQIVEKTLTLCCSLRSSLEDLVRKAIENDTSTFVMQCQMGEFSHEVGRLNTISNLERLTLQEHCLVADDLLLSNVSQDDNSALQPLKSESKGPQVASPLIKENYLDQFDGVSEYENSELMRELSRRDVLLQGLLFDFSLLQEFASHRKDIKDELEKLIVAMSKVQHELQSKTSQLDEVLIKNRKLEGFLSEAEKSLHNSNSELNILSEQNVELNDLLKNLYLKNSEAEQLLEDKKEAIKCLEKEIIRVSSLREKQLASSVEGIEEALAEVVAERDKLVEKLTSLQEKLDMASALADENQAIADEASQESETSKAYAEEKEEEVRILEHSIQELESTINVLENKVHEMEEEVEKQGQIRESLELVVQSLRHRLLTVEDFTESMTSDNTSSAQSEDHHSRSLEIKKAHCRIGFLEEENGKQAMEIRQYKDYISELVLHADAQASQYQQKYKTLEAMLHEVKTDIVNVSTAPALDKSDKISARTRGSGSPFRCIAGVVQQINQEKEHELSSARLRIETLEALAASRYKEVCMLNTKLATAESMTHDVIRDLLSVKLDISNYANIVDHQELEKIIVEAQHHREDYVAMEQEIFYLRSQIENLLEDRERCISEINRSKSDQLTTQIALEQLQERDQMLISQNDMLKADKHNLQKRVAELDDMVKKLVSMQDSKRRNQPQMNSLSRPFEHDLGGSLTHPQRVFLRMNNQLHEGTDELNGNNGTISKGSRMRTQSQLK